MSQCRSDVSTRDSQRSPSSGNNKPLSSKTSNPHPVENIFTKLFNLKSGHGVAKAKVKVHLRGNSRDDRLEQIRADERKLRLLRLVTVLMNQMLRLMLC